jgi:hypothetical protein
VLKRDLNNAIDSELSGSKFQQSMRRQENENERALSAINARKRFTSFKTVTSGVSNFAKTKKITDNYFY